MLEVTAEGRKFYANNHFKSNFGDILFIEMGLGGFRALRCPVTIREISRPYGTADATSIINMIRTSRLIRSGSGFIVDWDSVGYTTDAEKRKIKSDIVFRFGHKAFYDITQSFSTIYIEQCDGDFYIGYYSYEDKKVIYATEISELYGVDEYDEVNKVLVDATSSFLAIEIA